MIILVILYLLIVVQIDESSSDEEVKFKSNFMGSFCAGIFTPPNTIDFDHVLSNFASLLAENWVVMVVVVSLIVGFVPLCIIARRADLKDTQLV